MTSSVISLGPGSQLLLDGELVEVLELEGTRVTVRNTRTRTLVVIGLTRLVAQGRSVPGAAGEADSAGVVLAGLTAAQRREVAERAGHVREVLTGFRSGQDSRAVPGEPDARFGPDVSLKDRYRAKAAQLGVGLRTVERWVAQYRGMGEAGLVDRRDGSPPAVDARWDEAVRAVLAESVNASTPTRGAVLARAAARLEQQYGPVVPVPSQATGYRRLAELAKGTNAVSGSARGRRSIADRPRGVYGRLRATRPGEYVILDTQDLDVFAMEPVTCRWVGVQLTVAQDLFTRCILGLRVTPVSTKAVDVAGTLYESVAGRETPESWPEAAVWPYHGVPVNVVFDEDGPLMTGPVCAPETLVVDHGRVFLSAHVIAVCTRLGISIQPAQQHKPTDKPTVERFFRTLREGLIQHLPAYKGPDVYSRGDRVEAEAFLFLHELEDVIREWIAIVYHRSKHDGLTIPQWPHLQLSPAEMFGVGVGKAGLLRIPATPQLALDFLPVVARTIQHYGVEVNGLRYNGCALDGYRNATSPYGGALAGKWPIRINPDDVRHAWFRDPADDVWHRLDWEHNGLLNTPFSAEAAAYARRLAAAGGEALEPAKALAGLLQRWETGLVTDRRERRMAARLAAEYAALPVAEPAIVDINMAPPAHRRRPADLMVVDSDDDDDPALEEGFYDDAFEILS